MIGGDVHLREETSIKLENALELATFLLYSICYY